MTRTHAIPLLSIVVALAAYALAGGGALNFGPTRRAAASVGVIPNADFATNINGWSVTAGASVTISHDSAFGGSLRFEDATTAADIVLIDSSCTGLLYPGSYQASDTLVGSTNNDPASTWKLQLLIYPSVDCTGSPTQVEGLTWTGIGSPAITQISELFVVPPGSSMRARLYFSSPATTLPKIGHWDTIEVYNQTPATPTETPTQPTSTPTATFTRTPTPTITPTTVTATPTFPPRGFALAIDCDLVSLGIQDNCVVSLDDTSLEVGVVLSNSSGSLTQIAALGFGVYEGDTTRLVPIELGSSGLDANPDFNNALAGLWSCFPVRAQDLGTLAPDASSVIACFAAGASSHQLADGDSIELARVHYAIPPSVSAGTVMLSIQNGYVYDDSFSDIGSCAPPISISFAFDACSPATIHFTSPQLESSTIRKIPAGNAANADPSVPKANLWLCLAPAACAGLGEGGLRVVERATNVHTGDQNGDSIEDGLGAYEFSVEYDNFVIQSVNPCDIVFGPGGAGAARGPVDELNTSSPANADCSPDPGAVNNGTCSMSFVLENLVRFGCVTNGQTPGPTGDFDLASLMLIPHPDLTNDIFPGNNNGVLTVIKDNGCELVDVFGHPVIGSVNGGLTPVCGDLAVTVRILEGDMNLDCVVDVTDEQLISYRYGAFFGDIFYTRWHDLEPATHDLDIDIKDLQKVFGRDGSTCQAPIPAQGPLDPPTPFGD